MTAILAFSLEVLVLRVHSPLYILYLCDLRWLSQTGCTEDRGRMLRS